MPGSSARCRRWRASPCPSWCGKTRTTPPHQSNHQENQDEHGRIARAHFPSQDVEIRCSSRYPRADVLDNKLKRIQEIRVAGFDVAHVIHRHGMDDKTAFEVEAALIDAYPGLTNIAGGAGSNEYGAMHAQEIVSRYSAELARFDHVRALLISVNRSAIEASSLYEATRYAWKLNKSKAEQAEVVLATLQGEIVGAFIARRWLEATAENFPGHDPVPGRFGFEGEDAPDDVKKLYLRKRVPDEYRKPGAANPIKYSW